MLAGQTGGILGLIDSTSFPMSKQNTRIWYPIGEGRQLSIHPTICKGIKRDLKIVNAGLSVSPYLAR